MHFILIILLFVLFNSVISHRQVNNISLEENEVESNWIKFQHKYKRNHNKTESAKGKLSTYIIF